LQIPTRILGLVERVLITLPQAQRISASWYFGCMSAFIFAKAVKNSSRFAFDKAQFAFAVDKSRQFGSRHGTDRLFGFPERCQGTDAAH
jgi:hypothetical protein